ncbi:VQ motif-containing protein [Perilla frutescens var. hirtella]|uniref:VQ motif-containing protein n=1 Tax=Perilla frutescens var. hirtella TaxID=608512 RepID=A0AAD4J8K2_PERFH|nr:VQ motif-containing protein [Perilla frutescens var. hirtella]KAH6829087.1 VQ motif-containing protein [Perilla frutescens var. hirtella]
MENSSVLQEKQTPSHIPSPNSHSSNSSSSSTSTTTNGLRHRLSPPSPQLPSVPITRSDPNNPYPTTFVQADTSSFKQVVQMLTGSAETAARPEPVRSPIPPIKTGPRKDKSSSKLYERRNSLKNFKISPLPPGVVSTRPGFLAGYAGSPRPGTPEILSPSILDFPSLVLSPVTPLIPDPFNRAAAANNSNNNLDMMAEDKAIQDKGFYLHPSPANTPRDSEPRLLPLFPVTSPRVAGSSTAAAADS